MTTHYLVASDRGQNITELKLMVEGAQVPARCRMWALRNGDQIMYVYNRMHNDLKGFHLHGTYQNGAVYGLEFEDMVRVVTSRIGPDDKERYEQSLLLSKHANIVKEDDKWDVIAEFLGGTFDLLWALLKGAMKVVGYMIGGLLLIRWMNKKK